MAKVAEVTEAIKAEVVKAIKGYLSGAELRDVKAVAFIPYGQEMLAVVPEYLWGTRWIAAVDPKRDNASVDASPIVRLALYALEHGGLTNIYRRKGSETSVLRVLKDGLYLAPEQWGKDWGKPPVYWGKGGKPKPPEFLKEEV